MDADIAFNPDTGTNEVERPTPLIDITPPDPELERCVSNVRASRNRLVLDAATREHFADIAQCLNNTNAAISYMRETITMQSQRIDVLVERVRMLEAKP